MTHPFEALGLPKPVVTAVAAMGYIEPTPIQKKAVPHLLAGRDVLAAAQTGTGKTAAFALPMIAKMLEHPKTRSAKKVRALVLAPTRELAAQIDENIRAYCANTDLTTALVFGGVNIRPQTEALKAGADFLVATPGRLLDHAGQLNVDLTEIEFFVLDEADRMLDMGFIHDIRKVLRLIPAKRQTLLFSATFSDEIRALADTFLTDPVSVEIERNRESTLITQEAWGIDKKRKRELLRDLIVDNNWEQVLVFTRMKHTANRIAAQLEKDGIVAAAIHGNKSQSARTKALSGFKDKSIRVLVATDIAARGLDIEGLPHVINFELPNVAEDYVHRIGRTGRAGVPGHAVSLVSPDESELLRAIEKLLKKKINLTPAVGYEGAVPEDIARDEAERDAARAKELERLREGRRKARSRQEQNRDKARRETEKAAKTEEIESGVSKNASDRFEKKIRRPNKVAQALSNATHAEAETKPERRESFPQQKNAQGSRKRSGNQVGGRNKSSVRGNAGKNPNREDNFGNTLDYKPRSRDKNRTAQWEPVDPFAPEHQAIFLPQNMPGNNVGVRKPQRHGNGQNGRRSQNFERRRENNIKSTVARSSLPARDTDRDSRFESVSSNLPPGMVLRYRRR